MPRRFYSTGRREKCEKPSPKKQTEPEKKLIVLEFFMGQTGKRTSNWIYTHQRKFNTMTPNKVTALLDAMYDEELLDRTEIPDGTDKPKVLYDISSDGRKAIEAINNLRSEDHPLVKLDFFRLLD